MTAPTEADWLGLLLATESHQQHEWPWLAAVVQNRVAHQRWPETIQKVVLQPWQFSHFNAYQDSGLWGRVLWDAVVEGVHGRPVDRHLVATAGQCAEWCLGLPAWRAPVGPRVCFYYSPVSMKPQGQEPWWWSEEVGREFTPPGIDPWRFIFGDMA